MHLTLFVPDLLWPDHENAQAFDFNQADVLARLLFLANHSATPFDATGSWETTLAQCFGFNLPAPPLAALRLLGETSAPANTDDQTLLCADPVNLGFIQQALVLSPIDAATLTAEACTALIQSLNDEFAGEGQFFISSSNAHWYFVPTDTAMDLPNLAACSRLLGRRIDADESRQVLGRDGLRWLNRIQMCLNNHPVNEAREMQGLPVINSLWPWGTGQLEHNAPRNRPDFEVAMGESVLLRGLCSATGTRHTELPSPNCSSLILETALATAIAQDDLDAWRLAIDALSLTHIVPAMAQLCSGAIKSLSLIAPDSRSTHRWTLHADHKGLRPSLLKRWLGIAPKQPKLADLIRTW